MSDSDSCFQHLVVPEDLFVDGKPRIIGYNGCCTGFLESVYSTLGVKPVAEFMIASGFPIMIKRSHFKEIRDHITAYTRSRTFEEAFYKICSRWAMKYSQFDLIGNYLWHFKRDQYSWHINDAVVAKHPKLYSIISKDPDILAANVPMVGVMKHSGDLKLFSYYGKYICTAINWKSEECARLYTKTDDDRTKMNTLVDWSLERSQ